MLPNIFFGWGMSFLKDETKVDLERKRLEKVLEERLQSENELMYGILGLEEIEKISKEKNAYPTSTDFSKLKLKGRKYKELKSEVIACYYCGGFIKNLGKKTKLQCDACRKDMLVCDICKTSIEFGETAVKSSICNHTFHFGHILEWLKIVEKCPVCKKQMNRDTLKLIYFSDQKK